MAYASGYVVLMLKRLRTALDRSAAYLLFAGAYLLVAGLTAMLWYLAVMTAIFVGWYIAAKASNKRWEANAPKREAAALVKCRATVAAHFAREEARAAAAAADPNWFNWDGPDTVAGQPR